MFYCILIISGVSGTMRGCNPDEFNANGCKTQHIVLDAGGNREIELPYGQNRLCSCLGYLCNNSPWLKKTKQPTIIGRPTSPSIREDTSRATTEGLHQTNQRDVTWYSPDTHTDSEGIPLPTEPELILLPNEPEGTPLPTEPEGVSLPTEPEGIPLPTDPEGIPLPTEPEGIPLPTDPEGIPLPTEPEGVSLPTDSVGVSLIEKSMSTRSMEENTLPTSYNDHSTDKIQSNGVNVLYYDMVFVTLLTLIINIFW